MTEPTFQPISTAPDGICDGCLEPEDILYPLVLPERIGADTVPIQCWLCRECFNLALGD